MSKQRRRKTRTYKQLLKRLDACKGCGYVAAASDLAQAKQTGSNARFQCPRCGRELWVPMRADGVGQEVFEKSLRAAGELMKDPGMPPPTHFRFLLNGEEIFADPGIENVNEADVVCTVKFEVSDDQFREFKSSVLT